VRAAACPPRGACLVSERPPSDDLLTPAHVLPPEMLPAFAMAAAELPLEESALADGAQQAAAGEGAGAAASLAPLDRSLTKDDWFEGDRELKEASQSLGAARSPEPALAPAFPEPGEEGYVDTGGGILSFLLQEEEEDEEAEVLKDDRTGDQAAKGQELQPLALQHKLGGHGARIWSGAARSGPSTLAPIQEINTSRGTEG